MNTDALELIVDDKMWVSEGEGWIGCKIFRTHLLQAAKQLNDLRLENYLMKQWIKDNTGEDWGIQYITGKD